MLDVKLPEPQKYGTLMSTANLSCLALLFPQVHRKQQPFLSWLVIPECLLLSMNLGKEQSETG